MHVVTIINSIVGKKGNIGYRYAFVQSELCEAGVANYTICRDSITTVKNTFSLGWLSIFPRGLHYLRRNYIRKINTRWVDIKFFELFTIFLLPYIFYKSRKSNDKVAYIVELSPFLIRIFKSFKYKVVLDLPIAPNNYVKKVIKNISHNELTYHKDIDDRERECCKLADQILVPSKFVFDEVLDLGVDECKIKIIPFGSVQSPLNQNIDDKRGIDFVFAGNVSNRKGINFLLDAWDCQKFKNDRLHLCGRVNRNIRKKINNINSTYNNIILPGFVDTLEYFNQCDVYIFPSLMEGSSKSVYEAMNAGLACIVTHQSGSIIENGRDGFIINAFSQSEIQEALNKIKEVDFRTMGAKAKEKSANYTWERYSSTVVAEICNAK